MFRSPLRLLALATAAALLTSCSTPSENDGENTASAPTTSTSAASNENWQVSGTGQPYLVPTNRYGDVINADVRTANDLKECKGEQTRLFRTSKVTAQLVEDRFVLFSAEDGPGEISSTGAPVKYSASAFGAALAAYNAFSLASGWGDYFHATADEVVDMGAPMPDELPEFDQAGRIPNLPVAFKVNDCSDKTAVVSMILDPSRPDGQLAVGKFAMVYANGTWRWQMNNRISAETQLLGPNEISWGEWTQWPLS